MTSAVDIVVHTHGSWKLKVERVSKNPDGTEAATTITRPLGDGGTATHLTLWDGAYIRITEITAPPEPVEE